MSQQLENEYKYITMIKVEDKPKTSVFDVYSKHDDILGQVKFFPQWRQYCFFPEDDCVFSKGCMDDINNFIGQLQKILSENRKKAKQSSSDNTSSNMEAKK